MPRGVGCGRKSSPRQAAMCVELQWLLVFPVPIAGTHLRYCLERDKLGGGSTWREVWEESSEEGGEAAQL